MTRGNRRMPHGADIPRFSLCLDFPALPDVFEPCEEYTVFYMHSSCVLKLLKAWVLRLVAIGWDQRSIALFNWSTGEQESQNFTKEQSKSLKNKGTPQCGRCGCWQLSRLLRAPPPPSPSPANVLPCYPILSLTDRK